MTQPRSRVDLYAAIRRDARSGMSNRALQRKHGVGFRTVTAALEAHLALARATVEQSLRTGGGFSVLAEIAGMTAWLAIDRGEPEIARQRYAEAIQRAEQARHPLLAAYMFESLGQFETDAGNARIGLQHIAHAEVLLDRTAPDSARAWLSSVRATTAGQLHDRKATLAALKLADTLTDHPKGEPVWPWVFQFDRGKLASSRAVALGDLEGARTAFTEADPHLTGPKPRAVGLMEHARVLVAAGQVCEGVDAARAALRTGQRLGSRRILNHVELFIKHLPPGSSEATSLGRALRGES